MPAPPRAPALARFALLGLALASCGGSGEGPSLARLERLAFQPEGGCVLFAGTPARIDCSGTRPLLLDRYEVTRSEWSRWTASDDVEARGAAALAFWHDLTPSHPATGMTLGEAEAFAADEGMRLPTAAEWIRAAVGSRAQGWPWGPYPALSAANTLDLGLDRLAPVGTFETGTTALGVFDLLGNAAEWTTERLPVDGELERGDERVWALGGSFRRYKRETYEAGPDGRPRFNAELVDPDQRGDDLGFRLVADAETWLREQAPRWTDGAAVRTRLVAVGRAWGRSAVPLLRRLSQEPGAAPGLAALLEGALAAGEGR
ncbi:MAG: SUMF1/EgtB/PvdO family nonheme iron enzyme [Planctomycetes bacterium]|nr:SUMF1/EgtB/PvdO family nonheme iron enzyme [Planctomycetota bacterium]